ncbi:MULTISPECIES: hypothetical protein [Cyanophyceae]|uniref:hypothetical protein n=1 Tax=Cyanophyceae TaxID=3028117 RepID=UPI001684A987|nr:hypothetical protein [Trichocoleus sp. FACHB-40]MBD2005600.1 hypothetical protein [Trichocoleus sp. FACHB-40]
MPFQNAINNRARQPFSLASYTVAGLPAASQNQGAIAWVTDGDGGNRRMVWSDGSNWRYAYNNAIVSVSASSGLSGDYILIADEKASGTHGGSFTSGAWQTRILNVKKSDTGNNASLSSNQITLLSGSYRCKISAPAYYASVHKARLRNISDNLTAVVGSSEQTQDAGSGVQTRSFIVGVFTITSSKAFEVQHRCGSNAPTTGLGVASNYGEVEIYTIAEFWKIS